MTSTKDRFQELRLLGHGGMAVVHQVIDEQNRSLVARKRLQCKGDEAQQRRTAQLFEREFLTLAQLAHPRIVQVREYGVDEQGPWFTMELLDGGDLQELAPLPWRRACAVARDVASALSLLHSRGLIHRDVSPRNVRCTQDGLAKLIDFGALASMKPSKLVVGTPPCCAPEILNMQQLDARTDLYALGATLYFSLVGHHAYPARTLAELSHRWHDAIIAPSQLTADVPEALDALVLELLRLDPEARPSTAADVMQRLCAIDGQPFDESLLVARAYLASPEMIGREKAIEQIGLVLPRMLRGRGGAVLVSGARGAGKSMFAQACVRNASVSGATVVQASADDAAREDYGLLRVLGRELARTLPAAALAAARGKRDLLAHALPELGEIEPVVAPRPLDEGRLRPELQRGLREWLIALSVDTPLVLVLDDLHLVDEPSAALLALLAHEAEHHALLLLATVDSTSDHSSVEAQRLFAQAARKIALEPLTEAQTGALLRSVFGGAPNVAVLSHRLHAITGGNPRDIMRLAQHLVDIGSVRYRAGTWTLPVRIDGSGLPASMTENRRARLDALSGDARELVGALALCADRTFSWDECALLVGRELGESALAEVEELRRAEVAREAQGQVQLADPVWRELLCSPLIDARVRRLHARLAAVFDARPDEEFRAAQHRLASGDIEQGLDRLVAHCTASLEQTALSQHTYLRYVQSLPHDWLDLMEQALEWCTELGRPRTQAYALRSRLSGILAYVGWAEKKHLEWLIEQLRWDSGLVDWERSDPTLPAMDRLKLAIASAQARYAQSSEDERGLEPLPAIRQLGRALISATGVGSATLDIGLLSALPSLAPFAALSPALGAVDGLVKGVHARTIGRLDEARERYAQLIARLEQPDRAGLDMSYSTYMRLGLMNVIGMIEAEMGQPVSLERAKLLDEEPAYRVNAQQLRVLYHLFQGDSREADRCKRDVDLVRVESSERRWFEGSHLVWEVMAYGLSDDLTHIQRTLAEISVFARQHPGWVPVEQLARAEYERIRGDHASALRYLASALEGTQAGAHQIWPVVASSHLRTLTDAGRFREALVSSERYVAQAEAARLGHMQEHLRALHASIRAQLGDVDAARGIVDDVLARFSKQRVGGLLVGLVHEVRARIAIAARDVNAYEAAARLCRQHFCERRNPALTAKYGRLVQAARAESIGLAGGSSESETLWTPRSVAAALERCDGAPERARVSLALLARQAGSNVGFLFGTDAAGSPQLLASVGERAFPSSLLPEVQGLLQIEPESDGTTATDVESLSAKSVEAPIQWDAEGTTYHPVLLSHSEGGETTITGVAVLEERDGAGFHRPLQLAATLGRLVDDWRR